MKDPEGQNRREGSLQQLHWRPKHSNKLYQKLIRTEIVHIYDIDCRRIFIFGYLRRANTIKMSLPKAIFQACDETSLTLKCDYNISSDEELYIQYKEPHQDWSVASMTKVRNDKLLHLADVVDLKPGTAYFVRLVLKKKDGKEVFGPETVFDTKPIDCGPKGKKSCSLS